MRRSRDAVVNAITQVAMVDEVDQIFYITKKCLMNQTADF